MPLLPLLCAVVGGEEDDHLWGSGRGAIAGCPYTAMVSRRAIVVCYGCGGG